jgi:hypothetical protein
LRLLAGWKDGFTGLPETQRAARKLASDELAEREEVEKPAWSWIIRLINLLMSSE